jgi:hypothetical protein
MPDDGELVNWTEEDILKELKYLIQEGFIQIVERDDEYYFVISEEAENIDEVDEV